MLDSASCCAVEVMEVSEPFIMQIQDSSSAIAQSSLMFRDKMQARTSPDIRPDGMTVMRKLDPVGACARRVVDGEMVLAVVRDAQKWYINWSARIILSNVRVAGQPLFFVQSRGLQYVYMILLVEAQCACILYTLNLTTSTDYI